MKSMQPIDPINISICSMDNVFNIETEDEKLSIFITSIILSRPNDTLEQKKYLQIWIMSSITYIIILCLYESPIEDRVSL